MTATGESGPLQNGHLPELSADAMRDNSSSILSISSAEVILVEFLSSLFLLLHCCFIAALLRRDLRKSSFLKSIVQPMNVDEHTDGGTTEAVLQCACCQHTLSISECRHCGIPLCRLCAYHRSGGLTYCATHRSEQDQLEELVNIFLSVANNPNSLACCQQLLLAKRGNADIRQAVARLEGLFAERETIKPELADLARYREQGTIEECAVALSHYQACSYAASELPD
jgi:hypothetical protein